jgi:hypothetical protein
MNDMMKKRGVRLTRGTMMRGSVWLLLAWWTTIPTCAQHSRVEQHLLARARPYEQFIATAAQRYDVDPLLLRVVGYLETQFNPAAVSKRGARGMMQFMPVTAARYGLSNPHDPEAAIDAAARYLRDLALRFEKRADLVLAAYNAGETAVEAYLQGRRIVLSKRVINPKGVITNGVPPYRETRAYVAQGITLLRTLRSNSAFHTHKLLSNTINNSGQADSSAPLGGLVRRSIRAAGQSEPNVTATSSRQNAHRRSIYFRRNAEEK